METSAKSDLPKIGRFLLRGVYNCYILTGENMSNIREYFSEQLEKIDKAIETPKVFYLLYDYHSIKPFVDGEKTPTVRVEVLSAKTPTVRVEVLSAKLSEMDDLESQLSTCKFIGMSGVIPRFEKRAP
jgi:hypothetical protein